MLRRAQSATSRREGLARAAAGGAARRRRGRPGRSGVRRRRGRTARARELYLAVQDAWSRDDRQRLRGSSPSDLMTEWDRRLDDFAARGQRNVVDVQVLEVQQVGLVNRVADADDRVVVLMQATLLDYVEDGGRRLMRTTIPRATNGRSCTSTGRWQARRRLVPAVDRGAARGRAPARGAARRDAGRGRAGPRRGGVRARRGGQDRRRARRRPAERRLRGRRPHAGAGRRARRRALCVDVLETAVRRAVEAWLGAVDGSDADLLAMADPAAVDALLYGGDAPGTSRVVVRGAKVLAVAITRCDVHAHPAELEVHVDVSRRALSRGPRHPRAPRGQPQPGAPLAGGLDAGALPGGAARAPPRGSAAAASGYAHLQCRRQPTARFAVGHEQSTSCGVAPAAAISSR